MINIKKAKKYCKNYTQIANYEKAVSDPDNMWICHHINGEFWPREWLIANNLYYNRIDPHEFRFVTKSEHSIIHQNNEDTSIKRSKSLKGRPSPMKGRTHSNESKRKVSEALKGRKPKNLSSLQSPESKLKRLQAVRKRVELYNNYKANGGTMKWKEFQKYYKEFE